MGVGVAGFCLPARISECYADVDGALLRFGGREGGVFFRALLGGLFSAGSLLLATQLGSRRFSHRLATEALVDFLGALLGFSDSLLFGDQREAGDIGQQDDRHHGKHDEHPFDERLERVRRHGVEVGWRRGEGNARGAQSRCVRSKFCGFLRFKRGRRVLGCVLWGVFAARSFRKFVTRCVRYRITEGLRWLNGHPS